MLYNSAKYNWRYWSEPQEHLNNRSIYIPRGRVVGGSSSINSMVAIRGNAADYDEWAATGLEGWDSAAIQRYFRKIEDARQIDAGVNPERGHSGPIRLAYGATRHPISKSLIAAAVATGLPENNGFNGVSQIGAGFFELNIADGQRFGASRYLERASRRKNLQVMTGGMVLRLIVESGRVCGVVLRKNGREITARADGEIVLSAGAIGSPQILMLSGIGPAEHLREKGIKPVLDVPAVGENLQDHLDCTVRFEASEPTTFTPYMGLVKGALAGARYILTGGGPGASQGIEAGAFWSATSDKKIPDHQAHLILALKNPPPGETIPHGFAIRVCQLKPESRGVLRLHSSNPAASPSIDPRFLSKKADMESMCDGLERLRTIVDQPVFRKHIRRVIDQQAFSDRSAMSDWIRQFAETIYHPTGTCRMGTDNQSVVDGELRLRGVTGLRVADASIMPTIIRGNTNLTVMAIGEKAADLIRGTAS